MSMGRLRKGYQGLRNLIVGKDRASVDFDIAGYSQELRVLVIGEIKTLIFMRVREKHSECREALELMLRYHLDWLNRAREAWEKAEERHILEKNLDREASIGELAKELLGARVHREVSKRYRKCCEMYAVLMVPPYLDQEDLKVVIKILEDLMSDAKRYLEKLVGYSVIQFKPRKFSQDLLPEELEVHCISGFCTPRPWRRQSVTLRLDPKDLRSLRIKGCKKCKHRKLCRVWRRTVSTLPLC